MGIGISPVGTTLHMLHYLNLSKAEKSHAQRVDAFENRASIIHASITQVSASIIDSVSEGRIVARDVF